MRCYVNFNASRLGHIAIQLKETAQAVTIDFSNPIDLSDVGEGFDPNVFFDRFYTGDSTRISNTELGLSIVKLLSQKLGGKALATIENGMITFHIEFPKKAAQLLSSLFI